MRWRLCALGLLLAVAAGVRADEIRLKDGSKIVGTIVDFANDSFKVQTAYGFAMVRKDSIAQIIPAEPGQAGESAQAAASDAPATLKPAALSTLPAVQPAVSRGAASSGSTPAPAVAKSAPPATAATVFPMPAPHPRPAPPAPVIAVPPAPPAAPASTPAPPPPPAVVPGPIRESVQGNLYTNETYNLHLYRPPGWEVLPEARKALPNAITAMGTSDETTLFVIGREPVLDSLEEQAGNSEKALQKVYENYRQVSSAKRTVAGLPAVEWQFRGIADGHDWSVTALTIARGADVFTLLGMTYADSDLIQIRENVIAKMISSLQFQTPR
jgi:hypothetical protein